MVAVVGDGDDDSDATVLIVRKPSGLSSVLFSHFLFQPPPPFRWWNFLLLVFSDSGRKTSGASFIVIDYYSESMYTYLSVIYFSQNLTLLFGLPRLGRRRFTICYIFVALELHQWKQRNERKNKKQRCTLIFLLACIYMCTFVRRFAELFVPFYACILGMCICGFCIFLIPTAHHFIIYILIYFFLVTIFRSSVKLRYGMKVGYSEGERYS